MAQVAWRYLNPMYLQGSSILCSLANYFKQPADDRTLETRELSTEYEPRK